MCWCRPDLQVALFNSRQNRPLYILVATLNYRNYGQVATSQYGRDTPLHIVYIPS